MKTAVFLDTSYAIALANINDNLHQPAVVRAQQIEASNAKLLTTQAVMLEIGNALSKQRHRRAAISLLRSIESDPNVSIVPLSQELYTQAFQLYQERTDKEWGLVDCISFIVMQNYKILEALTADEHFQQAGFRALLRENY
jgi:predicted nucleic acid-binding protein